MDRYKLTFDVYTSDDFFQDQIITMTWTSLFTLTIILLFIKSYRNQNLYMLQLQKEKELALSKLEALNDKKNQLLALLSHDLKTPVSSLNFTLELAEEGIINEKEMGQIIGNLKSQSFHLSKVLDNTLEWVINEMEGSDSDLTIVNPARLTEEMVEVMQFQATQKSQIVDVQIIGIPSEIDLSFKEVRIILKNFLDNAIKFSPKESTILVQVSQSLSALRWEVRNQGKPVNEADRPFLFELKAKKSVGTLREKGTGIGLSLCQKIASKHKWQIGYLYSEDGWNVFFLEIQLTKS
jgi:signal transduction histidine kinase